MQAFFGAHHRIVAAPGGGRRLVGFNFSEEAAGGLLNFFEYDERFSLLHKTTRLLKARRLPSAISSLLLMMCSQAMHEGLRF